MNKTIIAVYGRSNEGKSETIKNVCKTILDTFPNAIPIFPPLIPPITNIDYNGDILLAIQIGKIKIGIESQGDPNSRMISEDTVTKLADKDMVPEIGGCDIIICATRTEGKTVNKVDEIANKYDYHTLWISSFYSPHLDKIVLNRMASENIINIMKSLIVEQL